MSTAAQLRDAVLQQLQVSPLRVPNPGGELQYVKQFSRQFEGAEVALRGQVVGWDTAGTSVALLQVPHALGRKPVAIAMLGFSEPSSGAFSLGAPPWPILHSATAEHFFLVSSATFNASGVCLVA